MKKFQGRSPMKMTSVSHRALALLLFATPLTLALTPGSGAPPVSHRALALLLFATPLTLALSPGSGAPPGGASVVSQRALMEPLQVVEAQLAALAASQLLATERMEKLAAATGHTQRAVNQLQDLQQQQQQQLANNNTQGASFGSTPGGAPPMLSRARWGSSFMGPGTGMYV